MTSEDTSQASYFYGAFASFFFLKLQSIIQCNFTVEKEKNNQQIDQNVFFRTS